jgi:hypothetical protein
MRLSEWRASTPSKEAGGQKVAAVVDAVIEALGAERDPHCWVVLDEEPAIRYTVFVPTEPGLIAAFVRVNVSGEGPRAMTKMIPWSRVSIGELTVETQAGHRLLSFQLEQQVLRGADEADQVAASAIRVIAAIDGRTIPPDVEGSKRSRSQPRRATAAKTPARPGKASPAGTTPVSSGKAAAATAAAPATRGSCR